jgi:hypothetical protein
VLGTTVPAAAAPPNAAAATVFTTMRPAAAGSPCRIASSGLPKPRPTAKNPCLRIRDVSLRGHRLRFTIRIRPGAEGQVWATVRRPGVTKYLAVSGSGASRRARGTVPSGHWTAVVHFKPEDNRLWQPVIARRRLSVR